MNARGDTEMLLLGVDGYAVGVLLAGELGGVAARFDCGNLGGGEGDDLDVGVRTIVGARGVNLATEHGNLRGGGWSRSCAARGLPTGVADAGLMIRR